jgi:type IV pilus assembly protein PilV
MSLLMGGTRQQGVTLIEVLVALVIVALGVLALTALQVISKRNTLDAAQHSDAAFLANSLLERMRGNASTEGLNSYLRTASAGLGGGVVSNGPACTAASPCSAPLMARHDLMVWEALLDGTHERLGAGGTAIFTGGLDDGRACLQGPAGGGSGLYTLTLVWRGGVSLPDAPDAPDCGRSLGLYGDNNELRRTLQIQTFIAAR